MRRMMLFLAVATIATPALASDWRKVGRNTSGSEYWVDAESMLRNGDSVTVWVQTKYGTPSDSGTTSYKAHREIVCATHAFRDLETTYFKGEAVGSSSGIEEWRSASPDSIADAVVKTACAL